MIATLELQQAQPSASIELPAMSAEQLERLIRAAVVEQLRTEIHAIVGAELRRAVGQLTGNVDYFDAKPLKPRRGQRGKEQA